jgi:hypothetical protein
VCPYWGPQIKEAQAAGVEKLKNYQGYCQGWSLLFLLLQILNPSVAPGDIVLHLLRNFSSAQLLDMVRRFITLLDRLYSDKLARLPLTDQGMVLPEAGFVVPAPPPLASTDDRQEIAELLSSMLSVAQEDADVFARVIVEEQSERAIHNELKSSENMLCGLLALSNDFLQYRSGRERLNDREEFSKEDAKAYKAVHRQLKNACPE